MRRTVYDCLCFVAIKNGVGSEEEEASKREGLCDGPYR